MKTGWTLVLSTPVGSDIERAKATARRLGCTRVVEDWDPSPRAQRRARITPGALHVTTWPPGLVGHYLADHPKGQDLQIISEW